MKVKTELFDELMVNRALMRISHEILEHNKDVSNLVFIGIKTRGVPMANILASNLSKLEGISCPVGELDITLYRDDLTELSEDAKVNGSKINFDVTGKDIILCDDVLYTGRTARAAIDAIIEIGRPKTIQLAVLIDRGHREFPIRPDYIGKNVPTSLNELISVKFNETDGVTSVSLCEK